jgi:hypothetical protein
MHYTTHGLMTPADLADHHALYDTGPADDITYELCDRCDGPLASDGVCADDTCGEVQAYDIQIPAPYADPEPMGTAARLAVYASTNRSQRLTPKQRRRAAKKAGRDPKVIVLRDDGMGYPRSMQGYREIVGDYRPVSGAPL